MDKAVLEDRLALSLMSISRYFLATKTCKYFGLFVDKYISTLSTTARFYPFSWYF